MTLALASDVDAIASKTGKIPADWQTRLPHNSAPYTSTIVFLVRAGNPKGIKDWGDLAKDGVEVITPNPKTSGGARWNYLAAWAWADKAFGGNQDAYRDYMHALFANVPVLDTGARGSTTTFAQRGIGDVLLSWENEAYLAKQELGEDQFDIVYPSLSILAEPTVAVVDGNIHSPDQGAAAKEYLAWLYSPEAQALALKNFYRAWDTSKADQADVDRFPKLDLVTIADFGGWAKAQPEHFGDGGIFDNLHREVSHARPRLPPRLGPAGVRPLLRHHDGDARDRGDPADRRPALAGRADGPAEIAAVIASERVRASLILSFRIAFLAAAFNLVFGLALAWVLARYHFPGRRLVDAMVDLPFALPTAVAGIALTALYAPNGPLGAFAAHFGLKVAYTPLGIWVALVFVGGLPLRRAPPRCRAACRRP